MIFKHNPSGEWTISLYNIYEDDWFHCGEYLKRIFGGGGHVGAAGATLSENEFIKAEIYESNLDFFKVEVNSDKTKALICGAKGGFSFVSIMIHLLITILIWTFNLLGKHFV